jgi:hypothetical protein
MSDDGREPRHPAVPPLAYHTPPAGRPGELSHAAQFGVGFAAYCTLVGFLWAAGVEFRWLNAGGVIAAWATGVSMLAAAGRVLSSRLGWTTFIPGVMTGVCVGCLVAPALFASFIQL